MRLINPATILLLLLAPLASQAQELEPRAYSPNPVGTHFLVTALSRSTGDVVFDASLPIEDASARLNAGVLGYGQTFGMFGHVASAAIAVPWVWGEVSGNVGENRRSVERSGLADVRLRFAVNLMGGEALSPREFARRTPRTAIGASVVVVAPTGQYDNDKLINIGANRWAVKPELGISQPIGRWFVEGYVGAWFFADNDEYFGDSRREQQSLTALQAHVSYTFRPQLWLAADATYYSGGRTSIDGVPRADRQENTRAGLTLSVPLARSQSLKISWSDGTTTRFGGDFVTYSVAWQYAWFDRN